MDLIPTEVIRHPGTDTEDRRLTPLSTDWRSASAALTDLFGGGPLGTVTYTNPSGERVSIRVQAEWEECINHASPTDIDPLVVELHDAPASSTEDVEVLQCTPRGHGPADTSSVATLISISSDDWKVSQNRFAELERRTESAERQLATHEAERRRLGDEMSRLSCEVVKLQRCGRPAILIFVAMALVLVGTLVWSKRTSGVRMQAMEHEMETMRANYTEWMHREVECQAHKQSDANEALSQKVAALEIRVEELDEALKISKEQSCASIPIGVSTTEMTLSGERSSVVKILREGLDWVLQLPFSLCRFLIGILQAAFTGILEACRALGMLAASFVRLLRHTGGAAVAAAGRITEGSSWMAPLLVGIVAGVAMPKIAARWK